MNSPADLHGRQETETLIQAQDQTGDPGPVKKIILVSNIL